MGDKATSPHFAKTGFIAKTGRAGRAAPAAHVNTMMRSIIALMLVASAALVAIPSASALSWVPPPNPDPQCPVLPPGNGDPSLDQELKDIEHDATFAACSEANNAQQVEAIAYTFTVNEVNIIIGAIRGPVDQTQDNFCQAVHGNPNANSPECKDIVLDLSGVSVSAELDLPPIPNGW